MQRLLVLVLGLVAPFASRRLLASASSHGNISASPAQTSVVALTRALAGRPYGVAVARDGTTYVALIGASSLRRGDLESWDFTAPVDVGSTPPQVVINPAGTRAYATLQTGRGIAVVDVAANALLAPYR